MRERALMRSSPALLEGAAFDTGGLLAPDDAVRLFLERVPLGPAGNEAVAIDDAFGRILAVDAVAGADVPLAPRSTMDGFAVASAATPGRFRVAFDGAMGHVPERPIFAGETMRIPTGGVLPPGADAVIPFEDVVERDGSIEIREAIEAGASLTPRGSDVTAGDAVLRTGRRIGARELGVLATLGFAEVPVFRRPRFAIISTGDELVDVAAMPNPAQVRDSNRYAIAGSLRAMGAVPVHIPRAYDTIEALVAALRQGLQEADGVFLTGGSSVGARDLTPDAIAALGDPGVIVHGIRVKPGKPTVFAAIGRQPVIGLPGNPASSLTILEAVIAPVVSALTGELRFALDRTAVAAAPIRGRAGWTWYVPVHEAEGRAFPATIRSSHTSLLARATGYVVVRPDHPHIEAGESVAVRPFAGEGR